MFERRMIAGWGDMDFNSHMLRNTTYLDKSADVRMMFFSENGFTMQEFVRLRIGPVIMRDELDYYGEVGLLDELPATLEPRRWRQMARASCCGACSTGTMVNVWPAYKYWRAGWIWRREG